MNKGPRGDGKGLDPGAGAVSAEPRASQRRLSQAASRVILAVALGPGLIITAGPARGAVISVHDYETLRNAIIDARSGDSIILSNNITLAGSLPGIEHSVTILGQGFTLSGANQFPGLTLTVGQIVIDDLVIADTVARGGNGGGSRRSVSLTDSGGTGGGGAGMGAALFVDTDAEVVLSTVSFRNNRAIGGNGGVPDATVGDGGGGGGSRFGDGQSATGGGNGGNGGVGGGGDGGSTPGFLSRLAQPGEFGGGGGGAGYLNGPGGAGGYGGGGGGGAPEGAPNFAPGGFGGGNGVKTDGGGGAGLGGAIFVKGELSFTGTTVIAGNTATGGSALREAGSGQGYGAGIFLAGSGRLTLNFDPLKAPVISDVIADEMGSAGTGGSWQLEKEGPGTVIFTAANRYSGGTFIEDGVLQGNTTSLYGDMNLSETATLVFDQAEDGVFAALIAGPGTLTKRGAGNLTLSADNNQFNGLTGTTIVEGGNLVISKEFTLISSRELILNGGSLIATTNTQIGGRITQAPGTKIVAKADPARQLFPTVMITRAGQSGTLSVSGGGIVDIVSSGGFSNIIVDDNTRVDFGVGSLGTATIRLSGGGKLRTDFDVGSPNNPIMLEGDGEIEVERRLIWSGTVSGAGRFIKSGSGILRFEQANTYTGGTVITEGLLELQADDRLGQAGTILELRGGTLVLEESLTMDRPILIRGTGTIATNKIVALNGVISGDTLVVSAAKLVLGNSGNSYAGIDHRAGELIGTSESLRGNIVMAEATVLTFDQATDGIFPGAISGSGRLIKAGTGRLSLTGTSSVGSETWIRGGTLAINGKLTSDVIIDAGGTLAGSKNVVGKVVLNGGKIAPGNSIGTITIDGSLDINSGTLEMAVSPTASDQIIVTGPDGFITFGVHTLQVEFEPGLYGARTYTLLSASQGIRGTIDTATAITPPANFTGRAFTTDKQVLLRLTAALGRGLTLSDNQAALTGALNATYNATDALPPGLAGLYGLTGASLDRTLTQASGEVATGLQTTTAQMTTRFLNLLLNPFMDGQSDLARARPVPGGAEAAAHASGWSVWASGLYGSDSFDGNAAIGSHQLSNTAQSFVMGADYGVSASTIIGVALGVGGSQWALDDSLGKGDGTALELGVYGITNWGPVYLSGALSFINNWASTDRTVLGERLRADIDAQSYGGRIEAGYRWATGFGGITPYAAGQAQWFNSGEYAENAGASYALDYASQSTADQRTELGLRFDNVAANGATRQWIFNARAAWAHDWFDDPTMTASFRSLPGTSFIVEGAQRSSNLALLSAGAEVQLGRGVSLIARFNSELGNQSTTLSGTGALRLVF